MKQLCFYCTQSDIFYCGIARISRGNKNKLRTFQPQKWQQIKNSQPKIKFTGSYKKKSVMVFMHLLSSENGETILKAHRQISKIRFFEKYCSCDKACQFSALQGNTLMELFRKPDNWRQIYKQTSPTFYTSKMCLKCVEKKKLLGRHNYYICKMTLSLLLKIQAATGSVL